MLTSVLSNSDRQCEALKKRKDQPPSPTSDDNEVKSRIDSSRKRPMSGVKSPTLEQQRTEPLTRMSSTTTPNVAESNKPKDTSQPKESTAPTAPQEQVQMQSSSLKVKRLPSTSSADDRKRVRFSTPQEKAELLTSSAATPTTPTGVPRPKGATQEVKTERTEKGQKSLCSECSTLKSTIANLDQQVKQNNKQLQSVVSYCEEQLKSKAQELASAQAKEMQLQGEVQRLQTSLSAREKELTQVQTEAQKAQQQVQQQKQLITVLQRLWKELGQRFVTTVASGSVQ